MISRLSCRPHFITLRSYYLAFNETHNGNLTYWKDVTVWKDIPFAAITGDQNRWEAPQRQGCFAISSLFRIRACILPGNTH